MRVVAVVSNIVLFAFTCFVLLTDGVSREVPYLILTVLLLFVPIVSSVVLLRRRAKGDGQDAHDERPSSSTHIARVAILFNVLLFGFSCWAIVAQYPHPKEDGVIAYALIVVLAPILNVVVFFSSWRSDSRLCPQTKSTADQEQREINEVSQSSNRY